MLHLFIYFLIKYLNAEKIIIEINNNNNKISDLYAFAYLFWLMIC
jgi:hypothetical protein